MKKVALALWVAMAAAGAQAEHGWGGYASYWEPSGWDGSFGGGVRMSIEALPNALVDVRGTWWDGISQGGGGVELDVEAMAFDAGLILTPNWEPVDVYLCGGLSVYRMEGDFYFPGQGKTGVDVDADVGFYVGPGIEFTLTRNASNLRATRITMFAEVLYRYVSIDEATAADTTVPGESVDGASANVGLLLRW
jgi:hypothetical protein